MVSSSELSDELRVAHCQRRATSRQEQFLVADLDLVAASRTLVPLVGPALLHRRSRPSLIPMDALT
jgi:hypothetical protein